MIKIKNNNLENIKFKIFFHVSPKALADKAFLIFLGLLLISLIIGVVIFNKYNNLIKKTPQVSKASIQFKEQAYEKIMSIWQLKEEKFKAADSNKYPDPFKALP